MCSSVVNGSLASSIAGADVIEPISLAFSEGGIVCYVHEVTPVRVGLTGCEMNQGNSRARLISRLLRTDIQRIFWDNRHLAFHNLKIGLQWARLPLYSHFFLRLRGVDLILIGVSIWTWFDGRVFEQRLF